MLPTVLIIAGHNGLNAVNEYPRSDKQSPEVPPGIYEGQWNRLFAQSLAYCLKSASIDCQLVNPGPINIPHDSIVGYVNDTFKRTNKPLFLFEIHANAAGKKWSNANGYTIFTPRNSKPLESSMALEFNKQLIDFNYPIRTRGIKQKNFKIITRTKCPALLFEAGFMDNVNDVALLQRQKTIDTACKAFRRSLREQYI